MPETELLGTDGGSMIFRLVVFLYMSSLVKPLELQFVDAVSPVSLWYLMREKTAPPKKQQQKPQELGIPNPPNCPVTMTALGLVEVVFYLRI